MSPVTPNLAVGCGTSGTPVSSSSVSRSCTRFHSRTVFTRSPQLPVTKKCSSSVWFGSQRTRDSLSTSRKLTISSCPSSAVFMLVLVGA